MHLRGCVLSDDSLYLLFGHGLCASAFGRDRHRLLLVLFACDQGSGWSHILVRLVDLLLVLWESGARSGLRAKLSVSCCFDVRCVDPYPCLYAIYENDGYFVVIHDLHFHLCDDDETISYVTLLQTPIPIRLRIFGIDDGDARASSRVHRRFSHHLVNGGGVSDGDETFATASGNDYAKG